MTFSEAELCDLQHVVSCTVLRVLREDRRLNGRLSYTELEASQALGVQKHQLRDCRLRGEIQGFKIGRNTCYSREELLRFIAERESF